MTSVNALFCSLKKIGGFEDFNKLFYFLSLFVVGFFFVWSLFVPAVLGMDVWDGLDTIIAHKYFGAPLNHKIVINPANIAERKFEYMGWFAPAQYMIPWAISESTGLSLGKSSSISYFAAWLFGAWGFVRLFRKFEINEQIIALSILLFSCQYFTLMPYVSLDSADFYLFAFLPWATLFFLEERHPVVIFFSTTFLVAGAFFLKFSAFISIIPIPVIKPLYDFWVCKSKGWKATLLSIAAAVLAYSLTYGGLKVAFLDKGQNVSQFNFFKIYWSDLIFPFAANVAGMFSLDNTIDFIFKDFMHTKHLGFKMGAELFLPYLVMFVIFLALNFYNLFSLKLRSLYAFFVFIYPLGVAPFFMILYFFNTGTDNTSRLFFFGAFVSLPLLLQGLKNFRSLQKLTFVLIALNFFFQLWIIANRKCDVDSFYTKCDSSFFANEYLNGDKEVLSMVKKIDKTENRNDLLVLPVLGISLELRNIPYVVFFEKWNLESQLAPLDDFRGRVNRCFVLSDKRYSAKSIDIYLKKFTDYDSSVVVNQTSDFVLFELKISKNDAIPTDG